MTFRSSLRHVRARLRPSRTTHPQPPQPSPADLTVAPGTATAENAAAGRRRRLLLPVATAAVALVLASGTMAVANAHKTVELDVDGEITQLSTFTGSVQGVLDAEDIAVGLHDSITPASTTGLQDGDTIVVRHGREVSVLIDGAERTVWTTALAADEALSTLASRGEDISILAGRSAVGGRPQLPLQLAVRGTVDVVADGKTRTVDGVQDLDDALAGLDITVKAADRVRVSLAGENGRVTVTVQRVVTKAEDVVSPIAFETTTTKTSSLTTGVERTSQAGVDGERTTTFRVVRVDGEEESRVEIAQSVTREPVAKIVQVGTAPKPAPAAPAASSSGAASAVGGDVWAALARCESGGNPSIVSANGLYHGLYQFSVGTWQSVGGSGLPSNASAAEQTQRAQALQARSGWGQWPACSLKLGLR